MSRLAKKPIPIPDKTDVTLSGNTVTVTGPLGTLSRAFPDFIRITRTGAELTLVPVKEGLFPNMLWGTVVAHIRNMIRGVSTPFSKKLLVEGIGFKAEVKGSEILFNVGFSHPVKMPIPKGLAVTAEKNVITITGSDIEAVGQFAARVRAKKPPEPYKGKGIHYENEVIRRKQGKKTA